MTFAVLVKKWLRNGNRNGNPQKKYNQEIKFRTLKILRKIYYLEILCKV